MKLSLALCLLLFAASGKGELATCAPKQACQCQEPVDQLKIELLKSQSMKELVCYMGMKSREIPDSALTSSSDVNLYHAARLGRLDNRISGASQGAWCSRHSVVGQWIQVDLGKEEFVSGVVTQGRPQHYSQWVTSFKVGCGTTTEYIPVIRESGTEKIFTANRDMESKVVNMFPELMVCRYIRIYPQSSHNHMSMRFEIISGTCHGLF